MKYQDKNVEISIGKTGLKDIDPNEIDNLNDAKVFRLQKLKLLLLKDQLILDAGCGPGTYGLILSKLGNNVVGVDISIDTIKMAKERATHKGLNNFMPIVADIESLPLREDVFDVCFVGWALHHFPTMQAVDGFTRVLKKNGTIAIAEPNEMHPILRISRRVENVFKDVLGETGLFTDNVSVHTYKDYCLNLIKHGFTITMLNSCTFRESVVIPQTIGFLKKYIFYLNLTARQSLCFLVSNIQFSQIKGTDLLILATKNP